MTSISSSHPRVIETKKKLSPVTNKLPEYCFANHAFTQRKANRTASQRTPG